MRTIEPPRRIRILSILFFCLVFSVYLLSYQGIPVSDDEQLFASAAQSLVNHGRLEAPQLYGNERVQGSYKGSGPLHPILASVIIRMAQFASLGQLQALYFLSPIYTALTGALLVYMALKEGYRLRTGLVAGVLFSLGTIAWPYSQTFFREPLAMLLLTLSWLSLMGAMDETSSRRKKALSWASFGVMYIGALLTKVLFITILPAYLVILWRFWSGDSYKGKQTFWRRAIIIIAIIVLGVAAFWIMDSFRPLNINTRLTLGFFERLWSFRERYRYHEIPGALLGMLFSPTKGLFVYSPCVLLAFFPFKKFTQQEKRRSLFAFIAVSGLLLGQATAYGSNWWNITWGTRFLLPIVPFLILAGLPAIERILGATSRWGRLFMPALATGSILIQLGGVLISNATYAIDLYIQKDVSDIGLTIWTPQHAPLIQNWRLLISGEGPDLAVWNVFLFSPILVSICLVLCFAILAGSFLFIRTFMRSLEPKRIRRYLIPLLVVVCFLTPPLMLTAYRHDPQYSVWRLDVLAAEKHLAANAEEGDVVLVYPYLGGDWYYFMNFYSGELPWYSLPSTFPAGGEDATTDLISSLYPSYDRIWLVAETTPPEPIHTYALQTLTYFGLLQDDLMWELYDYYKQVRLSLIELWK
jgi:hypothetical protein